MSIDGSSSTETSPLLRTVSPSPTSATVTVYSRATKRRSMSHRLAALTTLARKHVIAILFAHVLVFEFGNYLQSAPRAAIYEEIICEQMLGVLHGNGTGLRLGGKLIQGGRNEFDELRCKDLTVQNELAFVRGMQEMFDCLPALLLAIPYGHLANHYGRRLILSLAVLGMCLHYSWVLTVVSFSSYFPMRLVWLASLFTVVGGGHSVTRSLAFVIVSDVTPRRKRATVFFRIEAVSLISRAASSALSSFIMTKDLWLSMYIGYGIILLGSSFILLLPTSNNNNSNKHHNPVGDPTEADPLLSIAPPKLAVPMWQGIRNAVTQNRWVVLLLLISFFGQLATRSGGLLLQYVSSRFNITFARANLFIVLRMITSVLALILFIPILTHYLRKRHSPAQTDLLLARISALFLFLGTFLVAIAPSQYFMCLAIPVSALSIGFFSALRSTMTDLVLGEPREDGSRDGGEGKEHVSILYTAMGMLMNVAKALAGPLFAALFGVGGRWGSQGRGLPFMVAAGVAAVVNLGVWVLRVGEGDG